jgi:hypothetical protein
VPLALVRALFHADTASSCIAIPILFIHHVCFWAAPPPTVLDSTLCENEPLHSFLLGRNLSDEQLQLMFDFIPEVGLLGELSW